MAIKPSRMLLYPDITLPFLPNIQSNCTLEDWYLVILLSVLTHDNFFTEVSHLEGDVIVQDLDDILSFGGDLRQEAIGNYVSRNQEHKKS